MNFASVAILLLVVGVMVWAVRRLLGKGDRCGGCKRCSGCHKGNNCHGCS